MQPSWLLHTGQEISHSDFTSQRYFGVSWCLFITSLHVVEVQQCLFFLKQCVVSVSVSISGNPHCYDALYWHITIVSIHSLPHKLIQSRITITTWSNNRTHCTVQHVIISNKKILPNYGFIILIFSGIFRAIKRSKLELPQINMQFNFDQFRALNFQNRTNASKVMVILPP